MLLLHKTLPFLVSPIGVTIIVATISLLLKRPKGVWASIGILWIFSMPITAHHLVRMTENYAVRLAPESMPSADVIVVLSGMTRTVESAGEQAYIREWGDAVDRFEGGVALWKAGRAPLLLFTAAQLPWDRLQEVQKTEGHWLMDRAKHAGIPEGSIRLTARVHNTADEASEVARLLAGSVQASANARDLGHTTKAYRVLLVTSAFHMPRAQVLFSLEGMEVIPFPVDFYGSTGKITMRDFIPDAAALDRSSQAVREWVGKAYYSLRDLYLRKVGEMATA